jgi:hypothetical protein
LFFERRRAASMPELGAGQARVPGAGCEFADERSKTHV